MNQFSTTLNSDQVPLLKRCLENLDFVCEEKNSVLIAKNQGIRITVYKTNKVLFQGAETDKWVVKLAAQGFIEKTPLLKSAGLPQGYSGPRIGSDESGKGDYFGPLVTVAAFVDSESESRLRDIGVRDSKELSDKAIKVMAADIKSLVTWKIVTVGPERYNELYDKMKNLNKLLGWSHARALEDVLNVKECNLAITDQFGDEKFVRDSLMTKGREINLIQMPRAESDIAVASASIIAREAYLTGLESLSREMGIDDLPKGASSKVIDKGIEIATKYGFDKLRYVAKLHFRTTIQIRAGVGLV
jgi:ribonuclease HIII